MAVSRRLRFEVFTRDGHTCRYCGAKAPDVVLTIDHVIPVTLGGRDIPTNLVTACVACNAGKSSVHPESAIVEDVNQNVRDWARAIKLLADQRVARADLISDDIERFDDAWLGWTVDGEPLPRSAGWQSTVMVWLTRGLHVKELTLHIPLAMRDGISHEHRWRYFCGIGWNLLTDLEKEAGDVMRQVDQLRRDAAAEATAEAPS